MRQYWAGANPEHRNLGCILLVTISDVNRVVLAVILTRDGVPLGLKKGPT